ncbi:MAG: hypothetical protein IJE08_03200 [Clostridia bacterium]|nr:hypothetical protein [Clostridia bacterium]
MTERLYYDQTYLTKFSAEVTAVREKDGKTEITLNQSAFYPTSGGQPYDTGVIGGAKVEDVYVAPDGEVRHVIDGKLNAGDAVDCEIDWARRFDHMQQHAGEHMLAGAVYRLYGGNTIGLHLGADMSTIDVTMPDGSTHLTEEQIYALEMDVNEQIHQDVPIKCWFPDEEELNALPLRKAPTVKEHVRIVAIGDKEMVACGGTHPSSAGQIGMVKIVDARPAKGKMRLGFVCGMRAFKDYQMRMKVSDQSAEMFSTKVEKLPEAIARMQENISALQRELNALRREQALQQVAGLMENAKEIGGAKLVCGTLPALTPDALRELASGLIEKGGVIALLASPKDGGGYLTLFARSADVSCDVGKLLRQASTACGGKGGGKPDFAQGSAPTDEVIMKAAELLAE